MNCQIPPLAFFRGIRPRFRICGANQEVISFKRPDVKPRSFPLAVTGARRVQLSSCRLASRVSVRCYNAMLFVCLLLIRLWAFAVRLLFHVIYPMKLKCFYWTKIRHFKFTFRRCCCCCFCNDTTQFFSSVKTITINWNKLTFKLNTQSKIKN